MSLNFLWIQKYKPSKLNVRKKVHISSKTDVFFEHSSLTAHIFGSSESSETYCTSFERSNQASIGIKRDLGCDSTFTFHYTHFNKAVL